VNRDFHRPRLGQISTKLITWLISIGSSLPEASKGLYVTDVSMFEPQTSVTYREHPEIWAGIGVGYVISFF